MKQLTLRYEFAADDDFGWLDVEVGTDKFWGRAGFWVQWQDVEEFGQSLRTYPATRLLPHILAHVRGWKSPDGDGYDGQTPAV